MHIQVVTIYLHATTEERYQQGCEAEAPALMSHGFGLLAEPTRVGRG